MATNQKPTSNGKKSEGARMSKEQREARKKRKVVIFALEIVLLLVMLVVLWGVLKGTEVKRIEVNDEELKENMNETVLENETLKGYRNVALFGVDSTTGALEKGTRSDTMIIASINQDTGDVKLVSVYRDSYLNKGNDKYGKANAAYASGGPKQAMMMLNMNMDLNITDFVTVGFKGLADTIDALGGVWIDVDSQEIEHINNYQMCIAENLKCSYTEVKETGYQLLDGLQATAYCRIRYTAGNDFKRTQRQRLVITKMVEKAKSANLSTLNSIMDTVFPMVKTSFTKTEIIKMASSLLSYKIGDTTGFPFTHYMLKDVKGCYGKDLDCVVPITLESNVQELHAWLFGTENYEVSDALKAYSDRIIDECGYGADHIEKARNASNAALPDAGSEADNM